MSICNRLGLQTLGSRLVMPKNLPNYCSRLHEGKLLIILEDSIEYTPFLLKVISISNDVNCFDVGHSYSPSNKESKSVIIYRK